ncbi:thiamine pyrophosphate-binding protein [Microbacterium halotolerans]|uniref:thiamine pyrophosphate-binding protein n=1 Tax=Microbacterium halotolerans TaxID=246613 RepID=UPI000E6AC920|nr:thiamine pyrophosphate-binding protein [Microbacterium halotolerans]
MVPSPATGAAAAVLEALVALGVRHVVVSPGSRSQALALAAAELERQGAIRMHVRIDERAAAFIALGIGRDTGVPAVLVCTSGTAVANYLPAVLEAHHAGVPLLLLTADRPPELRGVGANQSTEQVGIFGGAVRFMADAPVPDGHDGEAGEFRSLAVDAFLAAFEGAKVGWFGWADLVHDEPGSGPAQQERVARSLHGDGAPGPANLSGDMSIAAPSSSLCVAGPAQLNLPFREPLAGPLPTGFGEFLDAEAVRAEAAAQSTGALAPTLLSRGPRTVVLAGADAGADAITCAEEGEWPLLAEVVSDARRGILPAAAYRFALRERDLGGRIERVVVFGHPTLNREETSLLSRDDVEVVAVRRGGEPLDLNGATRQASGIAVGSGEPDDAWAAAWVRWSEGHADAAASGDAGVQSEADEARIASGERLSAPCNDDAPGEKRGEGASATDAGSARHSAGSAAPAATTPNTVDTIDREGLVAAVWRASGTDDRLMFGSSRLVRVADDTLPPRDVRVHANRGLAGIDGTIATGLGIALASQDGRDPGAASGVEATQEDGAAGGVTRVLLGDLAFLHDVGALLIPESERSPRIQVIVGNDGGGSIFDGLEVAQVAGPAAMDRVQYTPQSVSLEHLAAAYGWEYARADSPAALAAALAQTDGMRLIEVPLPR